MDSNNLIDILQKGVTYFQPALSTVVGAVLSTLFLRKNTSQPEFEKIKAGKFNEVVEFLLDTGKMSYFEYYKCRNFLNVAKLADRYESDFNEYKKKQLDGTFDFDWYIRFFDSVGNVSNAEMQELWARILAGEINNQGLFSFRTMETLRNMNQEEAMLFQKIVPLVLTQKSGLKFIINTSEELNEDVNKEYGFEKQDFIILEECGIISPIRENDIIYLDEPLSGFWNGKIFTKIKYIVLDDILDRCKHTYKYKTYTLTQAACQLLSVLDEAPNNEYLIKVSNKLRERYNRNFLITVHNIIDVCENTINFDESIDLLETMK